MFTQRKLLVGIAALFAFVTSTASGAGAVLAGDDDMHWKIGPTSVISDDATQFLATCATTDCDDDMHW